MRHPLRNAILASLGSAALASVPASVSALGGAVDDLQSAPFTDTGSRMFTERSSPYKSFNLFLPIGSYGSANQGKVHSANWVMFSVGTREEQAAGADYDVIITMSGKRVIDDSEGAAGANKALDNPAFAVWTAGSRKLVDIPRSETRYFYEFSPIRGPNDNVANPLSDTPGVLPDGEVVIINNLEDPRSSSVPGPVHDGGLLAVGVLNGHEGWIGYAQAGPGYTIVYDVDYYTQPPLHQTASGNRLQDVPIPAQSWFVNRNTPWVDGAASYGIATAVSTLGTTDYRYPGSSIPNYFLAPRSPMDTASLHLAKLKAGNYLIALGGSCGYPTPSTSCGQGIYYTVRFDYAPVGATDGIPKSWNLSRDLTTAASSDNPHGQWSFRKGSRLHEPRTYKLMPYASPLGDSGNLANATGWRQGETYIGLTDDTATDGDQWTVTRGVLFLKPEAETPAVASWRSPITGRVRIAGILQDGQPGCGNGVKWYIDRDKTPLAKGFITDGQGAAFSRLVRVREGQQLHFIIGANGDASCDPTNLDLLISRTP